MRFTAFNQLLNTSKECILKSKVLIYFISAIFLFSFVTIYQYYNEDMTALVAARNASGDKLINSEIGVTRYQIFGERNTKTVILIHSFNGFLESWNLNVNSLVNAGYRVVVYDLFGRGLSDRPRVNYDLRLFRRQLASVISEVGAEKVHLVGSSFGCVIASDYANHHSEKVESLIDNPDIRQVLSSRAALRYEKHYVKPKFEKNLLDVVNNILG